MENGLVSVIIPAYRADEYLGAALDSVRRQRHGDWEVIVVEDGSRGATEGIVRTFAAETSNHRVIYARHETNGGPASARNTALQQARGAYLAFLDADDIWLETHLAAHVAALRSGAADIVYSTPLLVADGTGLPLGILGPSAEDLRQFPNGLFVRNFVSPSATVLRRAVVDAVGLFEIAPQIQGCEDVDYWLRCAQAGMRFTHVAGCHCYYRKGHAAALTANVTRIQERYLHVLETHFGMARIPLDRQRAGLAINYYLLGRWLPAESSARACRCFFRAWWYDPQALRFLRRAAGAGTAALWRCIWSSMLGLFSRHWKEDRTLGQSAPGPAASMRRSDRAA